MRYIIVENCNALMKYNIDIEGGTFPVLQCQTALNQVCTGCGHALG